MYIIDKRKGIRKFHLRENFSQRTREKKSIVQKLENRNSPEPIEKYWKGENKTGN
jgi:hypothetical protein